MCRLVAYPNCCGAHVIQEFTGNDEDETRQFRAIVEGLNNRLMANFIFNQEQIGRYPRLLEAAAELGFVISSSWVNGGHNSDLVEFQRCGWRRRSINEAARLMNWPGQVIHAGMTGELPVVPRQQQNRNYRGIQQGSTVRVARGTSGRLGREFTLLRVEVEQGWDGIPFGVMRDDERGVEFRILIENLDLVARPDAVPVPRQVIQIEDEPVYAAPVVVFSTFHNVLQTGRGAGFDTIDLARAAAPRCQRRSRRDIYSDGTVVWVENV